MIRYAEVALNIPFKDEDTLTYSVPQDMKNIQTGCRVEVPLKNRKESLEGVVLSIGNSMPAYECREITRLVDKNPVINAEQIELAYWMKEYYLASLGECLYKMIP
ncbi:MAG TPA: primosomal protein N', partial [Leptospiraceae bacterium]|nr:primosomal protein N' [Leptospiraceae bacterium]